LPLPRQPVRLSAATAAIATAIYLVIVQSHLVIIYSSLLLIALGRAVWGDLDPARSRSGWRAGSMGSLEARCTGMPPCPSASA
jgi:hypothetical protein